MAPTSQAVLYRLDHALATIWIAYDGDEANCYAYGGTRLVSSNTSAEAARAIVTRLMRDESWLKNRLINLALAAGALERLAPTLPPGFAASRVGGARCVIRPTHQRDERILRNPADPRFEPLVRQVLAVIGAFLNRLDGRIKLTPDFGRFAGLADLLAEETPHVLGIRCEDGGCGGKSSYSASGVLAAFEALESPNTMALITLVGAAGALGSEVLNALSPRAARRLAVADIAYGRSQAPPEQLLVLPAQPGRFTSPCLRRGGYLIATTVGHELERSAWEQLPAGACVMLAHNLSLPSGAAGLQLARELARRRVTVLPGQLLTFGGALTSRLEWFSRQAGPGQPFDKALAHTVVRQLTGWLLAQVRADTATPPYEALCALAGYDPKAPIAVAAAEHKASV